MGVQIDTIRKIKERDGLDLKEALHYYHEVMEDPQVDPDIWEFYITNYDQKFQELVEIVFQASDLKYDACQKIVQALSERHKLII